jgi:CYTH domain-containing protein
VADQEIERKFKIDPARFLRWVMTLPSVNQRDRDNIVQYYLARDPEVRIRKIGTDYRMCFKYPTSDPTVRDEVEWDISAELAHRLTPRATRVLIKERFRVEWGGHWWDVDCIFKEPEDVWVAEVELRSPNESFDRPNWLREEVTGRPEYSSFAFATPV